MIDMIRKHKRYGTDSGVNVSCDCPCVTIYNDDWENTLKYEEIYGFRKSGKYNEAKKMYTETFHLYGEIEGNTCSQEDYETY